MKKGLLVSLIAIGVFALASAAGANSRFFLKKATGEDNHRAVKTAARLRRAAAVNARSYRSPGHLRKVVIAADDQSAMASALSAGAIELSDYGSFKLFAMDDAALQNDADAESALGFSVSPSRRPF